MKNQHQQSTEILQAQENVNHWENEIKYAEEALAKARDELRKAKEALIDLYKKEDDKLPTAKRFRLSLHGYLKERSKAGKFVVILRQTPSGQLVCRDYGNPFSQEVKYKIKKYSDIFEEIKKPKSGYSTELEDVPQEFIDRARKATSEKR